MKLTRLYSNQPEQFEPVDFGSGLNDVRAEIRLPDNRDKALSGKALLGALLDFGLLAEADAGFFVFEHLDLFKHLVFFLEIELPGSSHLTIRRGVEEASKVSFKKHEAGRQDFSTLPLHEWNHPDVPFDRARDLLSGLLDWRALRPWSFRKGLGDLLRSQENSRDLLHLRKFASAHTDCKLFLAHILGFDAQGMADLAVKEDALARKQALSQTLKHELGGSMEDIGKIEGILLLKQQDAEKNQKRLDAFDFRSQDEDRTTQLADGIDERIASLNTKRYYLNLRRKKILASMEEDQILFDPDEAQRLFGDVGVLFEGQIKRDFQQLIAFIRASTDDRILYLKEQKDELDVELQQVNSELSALGQKRSEMLSFLRLTDVFSKYKLVSDDMVTLRADIVSLERQRGFLQRLQDLRTEICTLTEERSHLQTQIEANVEQQNADQTSRFSVIRAFFSEIVEAVVDRKALLSVLSNEVGHLEFKAEILDGAGNATTVDRECTYRKLLCLAFDMAVLRAYLSDPFPRFFCTDGVFESLDDRQKEKLLAVIRRYADLGLQPVVTWIDSDRVQ